MSCYSKENLNRNDYNNVCKSHSARSEREIYRVCPSKLSKRELEDLYFSLLENNLELKRTVNGQHDKIKGLSTKVQRMATAQRLLQSKEFKDCCVGSKFVINEQRESITELRHANQKLSDKVQQLNMRLCSAKQFHRRAPSQPSTSRCLRCATVTTGAPTIKRHSNADKASEPVSNLTTSMQCDNNLLSGRSAQTEEPDPNKGVCEGTCDENRCKTVMEELKMKIVNLQEELSMVHEDYSARLARLESEVADVRRENVRVAGERTASLHQLQTSMQKTGEVMADYRTAEARCAELEALLAIERRRVAELETQLKAANMSDKVNKAIEDHLTNINETNGSSKAAPNGTTRNSINGIANFTSKTSNGTTKSTFKSITKVTTNKNTSNANIKTATSKTASYATSKSTTKSTTKATPRGIPEAAIISASQAMPNATTDATIDENTNVNASIDENVLITVTNNENIPKNATTDDNTPADATQTTDTPMKTTTNDNVPMNPHIENNIPAYTATDDNISANATKIAATDDNIRKNATTEDNIPANATTIVTTEDNILANTTTTVTTVGNIPMKVSTDDNITTNDNIPTNTIKTAVTDGTSSPMQEMTENAPQTICKCIQMKPEKPTRNLQPLSCGCPYPLGVGDDYQYTSSKMGLSKSKSSQSKMSKVDKYTKSSSKTSDTRMTECNCTSHHDLEPDLTSASSTSPTKGDIPATKYALCACHPPQDTSTPTKKNKSVDCRCKAWQKAMEIFEEDSRCKKCCYKELDVRVMESIAKNVVPTAPAPAGDTQLSPPPADEPTAKPSDDSGYLESNRSQDSDELAVHKLNKQLLAKVQELQREIESLRSAQANNMLEVKKKLGETFPTPRTANDIADPVRPERPTRVETVDTERQVQITTVTQMLANLDDGPTKPTINIHYTDTSEKASTSKPDRYQPPAADTQLRETHENNALLNNAGVVTQYKSNTSEPAHSATDSTQTRTDGRLKVLKSTPLVLTPSLENVHTGLNKSEMVPDKLNTTQATDTNEDLPSTMEPEQSVFKFTDTMQHDCRPAELMASESQTKLGIVPTIDSLASNPEIGVIMHSKLARVRERGQAVKLYDGTETEYDNRLKLPMTEALVANKRTSNDATEEVATPELCEQCPACTFDRECATRRRNTTDSGNSNLGNGNIKEQATKTDQHNSLQIPGPLPTDNQKEKKRSVFRRFSFDKKKDKSKKTSKCSIMDNPAVAQQTADGAIQLADVPFLDLPHEGSTHDRVRLSSFTLSQDPFRRDRISGERRYSTMFKDQGANQDAQNVEDPRRDRMMPTVDEDHSGDDEERMNEQTKEQASQATHDLQSVLRERAEVSRWRDVSVYRRASGTLCWRPHAARAAAAACSCPGHVAGRCLPRPLDKGLQVDDKVTTRRVSIFSEQGTYTLSNKDKLNTSDNSDFELSYVSDLPFEKNGRSPGRGRALSPGEDKTTTTYSESYYSPNTNYSLSEGEVPTSTKRRVSYEIDKDRRIDPPPPRSEQSAAKMEAALRAITEELARCKSLLQQQRPAEPQPQPRRASSVSIPLRPGVATQSIGDAYAPKCIFTLHIGTVMLSDEAVLSSRDKTMVLTWKFYDQNVAMTRMRPGRVVVFDFSTEYDIKITDHFLNYMKHEEMPITICEMDKEEQPFATCSLPLRDALLHTNRRADVSLALLAGPRAVRRHDSLDTGDELGVIDLWCMLKAEAHLLPTINRAIAQQPSSPMVNQTGGGGGGPRNSRVMPQVLDEDHYEYDLSIDNVPASDTPDQIQKEDGTDAEYNRTSYNWNLPRSAPAATSDGKQELAFDPSIYPPMRKRRLSGASTSTNTTALGQGAEHDSGILINEVQTKIKSPDDMRQVLEKNYDLGGVAKSEDDASKANSSLASLKSTAKLHRRGSRYPHRRENQPAVLQNIRRNSKAMDATTDTSDLEIYKKYDNIGKLIGPNRNEASKKCVKISPKYTDSGEEEPQRDEEYREEEAISGGQRLDITVLWLALNEECEAMIDPHVQRVFVAYTFLGRAGADLETPVSLPKPKHYVDKCYFNFTKTFDLEDADLMKLSHMARCRATSKMSQDERDCIIFSVVSEPAEDPLGLESCEDIGYAYLYLGDVLAYSAGSAGYTEVVPVRAARAPAAVCGVLAVRIDGLHVVRRCMLLPAPHDSHS